MMYSVLPRYVLLPQQPLSECKAFFSDKGVVVTTNSFGFWVIVSFKVVLMGRG